MSRSGITGMAHKEKVSGPASVLEKFLDPVRRLVMYCTNVRSIL